MMAVFHFSPTLMALEVGSRRRQPRVVPGRGAAKAVAAAKRAKARSDKRRQAEKVAKELPGSDAAAEGRPQPAMKPMPKKVLMPMVVTQGAVCACQGVTATVHTIPPRCAVCGKAKWFGKSSP